MVPTTPQRVKREFGDDYSNSPAALSRRQAAKRIKVEPAVEVSETFSTVEEIKYDLSMVLSSLPSSNRAFSFSLPCSSLEHLPIPLVGLEITGIGGIGMPLAVRDALAIQSLAARRARVVESLGVEVCCPPPSRYYVSTKRFSQSCSRQMDQLTSLLLSSHSTTQYGTLSSALHSSLRLAKLCLRI